MNLIQILLILISNSQFLETFDSIIIDFLDLPNMHQPFVHMILRITIVRRPVFFGKLAPELQAILPEFLKFLVP